MFFEKKKSFPDRCDISCARRNVMTKKKKYIFLCEWSFGDSDGEKKLKPTVEMDKPVDSSGGPALADLNCVMQILFSGFFFFTIATAFRHESFEPCATVFARAGA